MLVLGCVHSCLGEADGGRECWISRYTCACACVCVYARTRGGSVATRACRMHYMRNTDVILGGERRGRLDRCIYVRMAGYKNERRLPPFPAGTGISASRSSLLTGPVTREVPSPSESTPLTSTYLSIPLTYREVRGLTLPSSHILTTYPSLAIDSSPNGRALDTQTQPGRDAPTLDPDLGGRARRIPSHHGRGTSGRAADGAPVLRRPLLQ